MTRITEFLDCLSRGLCVASLLATTLVFSTAALSAEKLGTLELTIVDEATQKPTPARVELLDERGNGYVADDALPVNGDCSDRVAPLEVSFERAMGMMDKRVLNPHTTTVQFYSVGNSRVSLLPSGNYKLAVSKGPEYSVQKQDVRIELGQPVKLTIAMHRWSNMPGKGWFSADHHLHIARPVKELNPFFSKWMQAEDIHVTNLLQWGLSRSFHNTLQYAHGRAGLYEENGYILATGQENPRTHFRGHTIILGAQSPINFPEAYVIYRLFWEEAKRQGALSGYAHWGIGGAEYGLGIDLPLGLLNFMEVLQFDVADYGVWYNILNTGFRMTPVAGTDYPCGDMNLPGRERFYTRIEGDFSYDSWLAGVRAGRTFVTNGPMLELRVDGKDIGSEIVLKKTGLVAVEGNVTFDPSRDAVERVEVIVGGELVRSFPRKGNSAQINFSFPYTVTESSWIAARVSGSKQNEPYLARTFLRPTSLAHSAATYLTIAGAPPISAQPKAKALAGHWLALLEDLEARMAEDQLPGIGREPYGDAVSLEYLQKNRPALLEGIRAAKTYFTRLQR